MGIDSHIPCPKQGPTPSTTNYKPVNRDSYKPGPSVHQSVLGKQYTCKLNSVVTTNIKVPSLCCPVLRQTKQQLSFADQQICNYTYDSCTSRIIPLGDPSNELPPCFLPLELTVPRTVQYQYAKQHRKAGETASRSHGGSAGRQQASCP